MKTIFVSENLCWHNFFPFLLPTTQNITHTHKTHKRTPTQPNKGARTVRQLLSSIHHLPEGQNANRSGDRRTGHHQTAGAGLRLRERRRPQQCGLHVTHGRRQYTRRCEYPLRGSTWSNIGELQCGGAPMFVVRLRPSCKNEAGAHNALEFIHITWEDDEETTRQRWWKNHKTENHKKKYLKTKRKNDNEIEKKISYPNLTTNATHQHRTWQNTPQLYVPQTHNKKILTHTESTQNNHTSRRSQQSKAKAIHFREILFYSSSGVFVQFNCGR